MLNNQIKQKVVLIMIFYLSISCVPIDEQVKDNISLSSQQSQQNIFVRSSIKSSIAGKSNNSQLWRITYKQGQSQSDLLYEVPTFADKTLDQVFSTQELTAFEEWYSYQIPGDYPTEDKAIPFTGMYPTHIAPNGQFAVGIRVIGWSPGGTTAFGMNQLVLLNLLDGTEEIFYEVSMHPKGWLAVEQSYFVQFAWSPDSQRIVLIEAISKSHNQAKIVNIETGEINSLGGSDVGGLYPAWSPDGEAVVMAVREISGLFLKKYSLSSVPPITEELTGPWDIIQGIDWNPDGQNIIFAAYKDYTLEKMKLYTVNMKTKDLVVLPLDDELSYEKPKWSPDGKLIAMNGKKTKINSVDKLLVYDIIDKKIVARLEENRSYQDFYWSDDGQAILLTSGFPPDIPLKVELFYWKENRREVIPLPEEIEIGVAVGISSEQ